MQWRIIIKFNLAPPLTSPRITVLGWLTLRVARLIFLGFAFLKEFHRFAHVWKCDKIFRSPSWILPTSPLFTHAMDWKTAQSPSHPAVAFYLCYTHDFSWRFLFSLECTEESVVPLTHRSNLYHQLAKIRSYLLWSKNLKSQEIL